MFYVFKKQVDIYKKYTTSHSLYSIFYFGVITMKPTVFSASIAVAFLSFLVPVFAMEDLKVGIVACGHGEKYGHAHKGCVTFNVEKETRVVHPQTPEEFKASVQYDEILDITTGHWPAGRHNPELVIRDNISNKGKSGETLNKNKNTLDVLVLEQPLPETLNRPWTLWNALHMVKVGGELIIETCDGYRSPMYEDSKFTAFFPRTEGVSYGDPENISKKLERFGVTTARQRQENTDLKPMAEFLAQWGLTDIINVREGFQPYIDGQEGNLETARKNRILSATKTQKTEDELEKWGHVIQKNSRALFHFQINK